MGNSNVTSANKKSDGFQEEKQKDSAKSFLENHISNFFDGGDKVALLKAYIPVKVFVGLGILVGGALSANFPSYVYASAAALLLGPPTLRLALRSSGILKNPHMERVIAGRMTARVDGDFCVMLIGARSHSPIKLTKKFGELGSAFASMIRQLELLPMETSGFLGAENFISANLKRSSHVMAVTYWRSYDDLLRFAHDRELNHFAVWMSVNKVLNESPDIGLWHEAYQISGGHYDTIYVNCPPLGLGMCGKLEPAVGRNSTSRGRANLPGKEAQGEES